MARVSFCSKADLEMLLQRRGSLLARAYSLPAYFYGSEIPYGSNTVNIHFLLLHLAGARIEETEMIHTDNHSIFTFICENKTKRREHFFKKFFHESFLYEEAKKENIFSFCSRKVTIAVMATIFIILYVSRYILLLCVYLLHV